MIWESYLEKVIQDASCQSVKSILCNSGKLKDEILSVYLDCSSWVSQSLQPTLGAGRHIWLRRVPGGSWRKRDLALPRRPERFGFTAYGTVARKVGPSGVRQSGGELEADPRRAQVAQVLRGRARRDWGKSRAHWH